MGLFDCGGSARTPQVIHLYTDIYLCNALDCADPHSHTHTNVALASPHTFHLYACLNCPHLHLCNVRTATGSATGAPLTQLLRFDTDAETDACTCLCLACVSDTTTSSSLAAPDPSPNDGRILMVSGYSGGNVRVVDVLEGEVKRTLKPDHNGKKSISAIAVVQLRSQKKEKGESHSEIYVYVIGTDRLF